MTTTTTPAACHVARTLVAAEYSVTVEEVETALTDSRAALLSWAGRGGRYTVDDLEAILKGHGETLSAWVDDCDKHDNPYAVHDAEALLTWLGY